MDRGALHSWVLHVVRDTGDVCAFGGPKEACRALHQTSGAPRLPLNPTDRVWFLPRATCRGRSPRSAAGRPAAGP